VLQPGGEPVWLSLVPSRLATELRLRRSKPLEVTLIGVGNHCGVKLCAARLRVVLHSPLDGLLRGLVHSSSGHPCGWGWLDGRYKVVKRWRAVIHGDDRRWSMVMKGSDLW
jgi:hypothetical protein